MRCFAQPPVGVVALATIDADTRWVLKTRSPVRLGSPIIRLGDVVEPTGEAISSWPRLARSPIGMFPVNVSRVTIDRNRVARALEKTEATPRAIDWVGPASIEVIYDPSARHDAADHDANGSTGAVAPASYQTADSSLRVRSQLAADDAQRIVRWIELAIKREHSELTDTFAIQIDQQQPGLDALASAAGVNSVTPMDRVAAGQCRLRVIGRAAEGPIETTISIGLVPYPQYVTARTTIGRGHRISPADLILKPIADARPEAAYVTDPNELVGMEVRTTLRVGQPIARGDVSEPIVVHRGDLVEVRVLSGAVKVTTSGKALQNGADSDLIEIETMQPKKRLLARVVRTGLVEIVTRAPAASYRETP